MSIAEDVSKIFLDCLYKTGECQDGKPPEDAVIVEGIANTFGLHPGRIAAHKQAIAALCNQMHDNFQKSKGGGWTFLNLCIAKDGSHWGEHRNGEQLLVLAIGSGQGGYASPRGMWKVLPGGMPYIYFDTLPKAA